VVTVNTIPTAAGLASSASGYAALVRALDALFGWNLPVAAQSILARLGSGSACRSLFNGFAEWQRGEQADGMDSHGVDIEATWPGLAIGLVKVSTREKAIGSREAMQRTVETSPLYPAWPDQVARDLVAVKAAIATRDVAALGRIAEHNAMTMHATAIAAWPPALFWHPESVAVMQRIWKLRTGGATVYFTMDAGPNLKLITEQKNIRELADEFPDAEWVTPFGG
jgi:diphosphomevalonate decarboxylase